MLRDEDAALFSEAGWLGRGWHVVVCAGVVDEGLFVGVGG
jgi:hypothetical protein